MLPTTDQRLAARTPDGNAPLVFLQNWEHLLLLHWKVDPDQIQATLPPGLHVDTTGDDAWLSIVPFCMSWARPRRLPALPLLSHFLQLNVRTYVYDDEGKPGVWFYSLDCSSGPSAWVARKFFKLPYFQARMKAAITDDVHYTCRRADRYGGAPYGSYRLSVYRYSGQGQIRIPEDPESLPFFLLERYYFYAWDGQKVRRGQVAHSPYRYQEADVATFDTIPLCLDDLPLPSTPPDLKHYVDKVKVDVYGLQ
ncbi:MAG: DUF2071 domain-containing protein [Verrucomicrobiota bacterium JB024]|nr:DUF2071 domain-containing protein [Verrucomicrobiota bacterium JB024]